jgi:folate-binding protein YgfZ
MRYAAFLDNRSVLALTGADTSDFLQGLVTADLTQSVPGKALYAALLTPQGKILFEFFLVQEHKERFLIDCAAERAADLTKRLTLYKLRAKVTITPTDFTVAAVWGNGSVTASSSMLAYADPRLTALGQRLTGPKADIENAISGIAPGDYAAHRISLGVPDSADLPSDSVFALDAGLEELGGVSFKKGCYVGQEVTARMKHRATARRRFLIADVAGVLPPFGTPLTANGTDIGTLANGANGRALALVRLDRLTDAAPSDAGITAAGVNVALHRPEWFHG